MSSLTNGTSYTFRIRAVNDHNGDSTDDPGAASEAVSVKPGLPTAPASFSVTPGNAQATLTWRAPASDGGSAVTGYEYTSNAGANTPTWADISGSDATTTSHTVTSLTNNTAYAFAVRAENANGQGAATPTIQATPAASGVPQRPATFRAEPGNGRVRLTWTLPSFQHPVDDYQYRQSTNGGTSWTTWTTISMSDAGTTEHTLTSLTNDTPYTFELRARKNGTAGPAARTQATPSAAAATRVITPESLGEIATFVAGGIERLNRNTHTFTAPDGDTYTVTRLLLPDDLDWRITVPGTTNIDKRTFTLLSLQGGTPETSPRYTFTSSGQEGLDIKVSPVLSGSVQVCLKPSERLRLEASAASAAGQPLLLLHYDGTDKEWEALTTTYEHGMACADVSSFSPFVLGYEDPEANEDPQPHGTVPPQTVVVGRTVSVNVAPYFTDANDDSLTYTATSSDTTKVTVAPPVTGSELSLTGVAAGSATVTVTATDPDEKSATQTMSVTVEANATPTAAAIPAQNLNASVPALRKVLVDLTRYFSDGNGDALTYSVATSGHATGVVTAAVRQASGVLMLTAVNAGTTTVTVTAADPDNATATATIAVAVTANTAPTVGTLPPQTLVAGRTTATRLNLADYFSDADNDPLTYTATSSDTNRVTAAVAGSVLKLTPGTTAGTATVTVRAEDPAGGTANGTVSVTVGANSAPTVTSIPAQTLVLNVVPRVLVPLNAYFSDANNDVLTYTPTSGDETVVTASVAAATGVLTLTAVAASDTAVTVTVTARDPDGATISQTIAVTVSADPGQANVAPVATQVIPAQELEVGGDAVTLDLADYFTDPNTGDVLTYTAPSPNAGVVTTNVSGSQLTLTGAGVGTVVVQVTATDQGNLQSLLGVTVTVRTPATPNRAPAQTAEIPAQTVAAGRFAATLDLTAYVTDPDGDELSFEAVSQNEAVVSVAVARRRHLTLIGVARGQTTVSITARDPAGLSALLGVAVTVTGARPPAPERAAAQASAADNAPPVVAQTLAPQVVAAGTTGEPLDLGPYFREPDGDPLTYVAVSENVAVAIADLPRRSSRLTLHGVGAGQAVVTVTASDPQGGSVSQRLTVTVTLTVPASDPPEVAQRIPPQTVAAGAVSDPLDLGPYFREPDGDPLTYSAVSYDADLVVAQVAAGGSELTLRGVAAGDAGVIVTASDPYGGQASQPVTVTVRANTVPEAVQPIPAQVVAVGEASEPMDLAPYFHEADGDPLTYAAVSRDPAMVVAEVPEGGSRLVLRGVGVGEAVVEVTASDPDGAGVMQSLRVRTNTALAVGQRIPAQTVAAGTTSEPLDLAPYFHVSDGVPLTFAAVSRDPGVVLAEVAAGGSQLTLIGVAVGEAVVDVTASDAYGGSVSQAVTVRTSPRPATSLPIPVQAVAVGSKSAPLDLAPYFHESDDVRLTYTAVSLDPDVVIVHVPAGSSQLVLGGVSVGEAVVIVTASDPWGGSVMHALQVRTNTAPTVAQAIPAQVATAGIVSAPLDLGPYFRDAEGDPLTCAAESDNTGVVIAEVPAGSSQLLLVGVAAGEAVVTVTASDPWGGSVSQTLTVRTDPAPASQVAGAAAEPPDVATRISAAPQMARPLPAQVVAVGGRSAPLDLAPYFHDPDGAPLTYAAVSDDAAVVTAEVPAGSSQLVLGGVAVGEAVVTVTASDPYGGSASQTVTVRTNTAPAVVRPVPAQVVAAGASSEPLDLAPYFRDADGDPLTYAAVSDDTGVVTAEVPDGGSRLVLGGVAAGEAVVVVTAGDPHGGSVMHALRVRTNTAPAVVQPLPVPLMAVGGRSEPLDLGPYFHDADGDPLTYAAVSDNPEVVTADLLAGGSRLVLSGVAAGEAVVTVTASDSWGGSASQTLTVRTNTAPRVAQPFPAQVVAVGATSEPLDLGPYFHDADGDPLTYAAVSDDTGVVVAEVVDGGSGLVLIGVAAGEAVVTVTASDPWSGSASQTLTVRTNTAPRVAQPIPSQVVAVGASSEPLDLAPYFHDADGDPLTYAAVSDDTGVVTAEVPEGGSRLVLGGVAAGEAVVTVTASDPWGGSAGQTLTVRTNTAPTVAHPIPAQVVAVGASSEPLDLAPYFHDADGDPLTYAAVSDDTGVVTAEVPEGGSQLVLGGVAAGEAVVTVTASDPWGGSAGQTVAVRTNTAPRVAQPIPAQVLAVGASSEPLDLGPYFHDADGDPLTYGAVSANPEVATADVAGALFTVTGVAAGAGVVTVTASDPHDAAASQSVTVTVRVADPAWVKAWIARFGRTVSGQVLDGVQERLRVARQPGFEATLAGHRVGGSSEEEASEHGDPGAATAFRRELGALAGWMDEQMDGPAGGDTPGRSLTGRDLLTSTAFTLTGGDADNGFGALWGRGVVSHFAGEDGALSLDGEVATGMLGADWVSGRWLTGLTLALSRGTGGYRTADGSGDIESTLTGLYPWTGYRLSERLSLWAAAGYGAGTLTLTPQDEAPATTDLSLALVAAGARSEHLPALGGVRLALETDTRLTRTSTGATAALGAADATVWQVRLGLEGSRRIALTGGGALRPSIEVGLRHDGGDAETGSGVELGAGLSFSRPASGLSLDLAARRLLAHRAPGLEEWGASASLTWDPTPSSDRGLSVSLQQTVGASSAGGVDALLARETLAAPGVAGVGGAGRLQARAGYGVPLGRGRFIGTPQLGFGLSQGQHDYTLGWHLSVARRQELDLTLGVEASRRENPDASDAEHGVMLQLRLGH